MEKIIKNEQAGRSMVEMLGVLAIIGVLSVGGIAGYSKAMTKFKINKSMDQVTTLVTKIRTMYGQQKSYEGLDIEQSVSMGIIPSDMVENSTSLTNAFAGTVLLGNVKFNNHDAGAFQLVYNGLGQEACVTMATSDWGSGSSSGLLGISISGSSQAIIESAPVATQNGSFTGTDLPVKIIDAVSFCECEASNNCSIAWYYQ